MPVKFIRLPEHVTLEAVLNGFERINAERFDGAFEVIHRSQEGRFGGTLVTMRHHCFEFDFWLDTENLLSWSGERNFAIGWTKGVFAARLIRALHPAGVISNERDDTKVPPDFDIRNPTVEEWLGIAQPSLQGVRKAA